MSDDENVLDFGPDAELEYGEAPESLGLLGTYPTLGRAYNYFLGAMDRVWEFAAVFQPLFKNSWVFFIIYLGISTNKSLRWSHLVPLIGGPVEEDDDDMF